LPTPYKINIKELRRRKLRKIEIRRRKLDKIKNNPK